MYESILTVLQIQNNVQSLIARNIRFLDTITKLEPTMENFKNQMIFWVHRPQKHGTSIFMLILQIKKWRHGAKLEVPTDTEKQVVMPKFKAKHFPLRMLVTTRAVSPSPSQALL